MRWLEWLLMLREETKMAKRLNERRLSDRQKDRFAS
jgi:hypothetical protein